MSDKTKQGISGEGVMGEETYFVGIGDGFPMWAVEAISCEDARQQIASTNDLAESLLWARGSER